MRLELAARVLVAWLAASLLLLALSLARGAARERPPDHLYLGAAIVAAIAAVFLLGRSIVGQ